MRVNRFWMVICIFIVSCSKKELTPSQFLLWLADKDNGLVKEEVVEGVRYIVSYKPSEYEIAKSIVDRDSNIKRKSGVNHHSFVIRMEPEDGKTQVLTINTRNKEEPYQRINYYLSQAQHDIKLIEGNDTMHAVACIYERYYNISPVQNLVIGFSGKNKPHDNDLILQVEDRAIGTGILRFRFRKEILNNIPNLLYQNE